ncbi:MAG TPA: nicotinate-nucleotide adenylyltransferase [Coxiellaceae bacterium]|nr:nicotinate-nucleotide adenylyltransferase [Coxiellaceae bacterium]
MTADFRPIGLLGGTFDPIHLAHLNIANTILQKLNFKEVRLIPSKKPPHRESPNVSAEDRLNMVKLALLDFPELSVDDRELQREGISYAVDTLHSIRTEVGPHQSLCFIMGADAFASLNQWKDWQGLLKLAHFIVVNRPGFILPQAQWLQTLLDAHEIKEPEKLKIVPAGCVYFQQLPPSAISATQVRCKSEHCDHLPEVTPKVKEYIQKHHLYKQHAH